MIHSDCELLTKEGWKPISSGEFLTIRSDGQKLSSEWAKLEAEEWAGRFIELSGRFFSCCVDENHPLPVISYGSSIHGHDKGILIPAKAIEPNVWVAINNFVTKKPFAANPYMQFIGANKKLSDGKVLACNDNAQFRLIPDIVEYNRYQDIARLHGRDKISALNRDEMYGVVEFANYPEKVIDQIELSALGDNKRNERLGPKRLRVFPDRFRLRISDIKSSYSSGFKIEGDYDFLLVRHKGKVAIV